MLKLHQLDAEESDTLYPGVPGARGVIASEERRRMWWVVFLADRFLTSTTGWPSLINERYVIPKYPVILIVRGDWIYKEVQLNLN